MKLSRNGKVFAVVNVVGFSLFYKGIDYYGTQTGERSGIAMSAAALLTITALLPAAWFLLRRENERQRKVNLSLVYHFTSVIIASLGWCIAYALSDYVQPIDLAWIGALGGGSVLAHWLLTHNKTKGINSKKAFL